MGDASTQIPCMIRLFFALTKCDIKYFGGITLFWTCIDLFFSKNVTSHAKTFRTDSRFKTDSRSSAVRTDRHAVRMPRAIRSKKFIICSNGSGYLFKKTHQLFERLKLSVQKKSSAVRTARAIRSRNSSAIWMAQAIHSRNSQPFQQDKTSKQFAILCSTMQAVMFTLHKQSSRFCSLFIFV